MAKGRYSEFHQELHPKFEIGSLTQLKPREVINRGAKYLKMLNIEPTNFCNLSCTFCTNSKQEKLTIMDMQMYMKILDDLRGNPQLVILNFHKDGEPLLHPQLVDMVALANARNVAQTYHLNTNGTMMTYELAKGLLNAGLNDITFSIDAFEMETYYELKGVNALLETERGVMNFLQAKSDTLKAHCCVRVKIMEHPEVSKREIGEFVKYWERFVDQVQVTGCHNWSNSVSVECTDIPQEGVADRWPCNLLWYTLAINSDGKVSICNLDWGRKAIVGDVNESNLLEIFNGKEMEEYRVCHTSRRWEPSICKDCVVWASGKDLGRWYGNHR